MDEFELEAAVECQDVLDEGSFSSSRCGCCGSYLGGDRFKVHGWFTHNGELWHGGCCVDCLMFIANGELPAWEG